MKGTAAFLTVVATAIISASGLLLVKGYDYTYHTVDEAFKNPMMGFAPCADDEEAVGDNTLVYVDITWRELEPEKGKFDFERVEKDNFLDQWREQGKKVVFRFVCDKPDEEEHMDIPDWLYEKTGDGTFYDCSYGKGYSPDYTNKTFIRYHKKAIEALGEEYGQDSFFCFIELGSLGHWGEWHVNYAAGIEPFPEEKVCRQYVLPYLEAFPNAKLLMRRPFSFVSKYGMGVYNDMAGEAEATREWLDWIEHGGLYDEAKKPMTLTACQNIWESSPVGGEFTSSISMKKILVTKKKRTLSLLKDSHMTFLGPKCPNANEEEAEYPKEVSEILKNVGYRYGVSDARITYNKLFRSATVEITMKNYGVAPMYESWPVCLYVMDEQGEVLKRYETEMDLTEISEGKTALAKVKIQDREFLKEEMPAIAVGIENPESGEPEVFLDMDTDMVDKRYWINK